MKKSTTNNAMILSLLTFVACLTLMMASPVFAQGGLQKVNTFVQNVLLVLRGISISVVTIAIMWAGYKFLFKHAEITEVGKILGGGLLIGGAAELAAYLLS
ncbi:MAG TPA: TrbC/VirB2 family protein [Oligoflexus sp.]|uniref:TrbC/VirB2 family protein n=1 Tax=Oligoflexus sp. TaxID=1971216 RepID=UPI002D7F60EC|nr:TrbC/VirB2 family protein [Oligoflexus sp.]HET9239208.1 TrbC/VirB2 family protein [Oligoflexus sp.]